MSKTIKLEDPPTFYILSIDSDPTDSNPNASLHYSRQACAAIDAVLSKNGFNGAVSAKPAPGAEGQRIILSDRCNPSVSFSRAVKLANEEIGHKMEDGKTHYKPWSFVFEAPIRHSDPDEYKQRAIAWLDKKGLMEGNHYQIESNEDARTVTFRFNTHSQRGLFGEALLTGTFRESAADAAKRQEASNGNVVSLTSIRTAKARPIADSSRPGD